MRTYVSLCRKLSISVPADVVFVAATGDTVRKGNRVEFAGPSTLVFDPCNPIRHGGYGAIAWIETDAPVRVWLEGEEVQ